MKLQHIFSDLCDNCDGTLIYAEYHEDGNLIERNYQVSKSEVTDSEREKYDKMLLSSDRDICKCKDPFPNLFSCNY